MSGKRWARDSPLPAGNPHCGRQHSKQTREWHKIIGTLCHCRDKIKKNSGSTRVVEDGEEEVMSKMGHNYER
jgi:hypothetical protein